MDPYLENRHRWAGFHNEFLVFLNAALNRILPEGFVSRTQERCYVLPTEHEFLPDAMVLPTISPSRAAVLAPAERAAPTGSVIAYPIEQREAFVEVVSVVDLDEVITVIELLSPSNKEVPGRDLYVRKQLDLLESNTNLVELDLLRRGQHLVAAPKELLLRHGTWDYLVSTHRPARRYHYDYYFLSLRQPLPEIRIPLSPNMPDIIVCLQEVFTLCYDSGGYARLINYSSPSDPPLAAQDRLWAEALRANLNRLP